MQCHQTPFYHAGLGHDAKWINGRTHAIFGFLKPLAALAAQGVEQLRLASAGFAHEYQGFSRISGVAWLDFPASRSHPRR